MGEHSIHREEEFNGPRGLCQAIPDDVLLDIFDFYLDNKNLDWRRNVDEWHTLVHVCQRWRHVVFASPRRLDLRLLCTKGRPVRDMLDIWPALPINIKGFLGEKSETLLDSIVAALEHRDRVRSINLKYVPSPQGERLAGTALQVQFPELTEMRFWTCGPVLPDSFLGGSAPRLRTLWLTNVPFPAARTLILSARALVDLRLDDIPHLGYIPPASMVACLSSLNKLESLSLGFESRRSRPDRPSSPPQSRVVLPALIKLLFNGRREYSEDLVARIDTPVLNQLNMTFFPRPSFDVPCLKQFIDRAKGLKPSKAAELRISPWSIHLDLHGPSLGVRCDRFDWQLSSFALLCGQVSHLLSLVERLDLPPMAPASPSSKSVMVSTQFLEIFRLFTSIRSLHVPEDLMPLIASALHELIGERATEVLPNLRDIFLERSARSGSILEVMQPFIDARRLSGRPVAVHYLEEAQKMGR
ncbi:hypothetical protein BC826DRAFT_454759 [Russula brevipes]|nr:hypothetical protein BC826DRAFT_454759 [Russula brevipes]